MGCGGCSREATGGTKVRGANEGLGLGAARTASSGLRVARGRPLTPFPFAHRSLQRLGGARAADRLDFGRSAT